LEHDEKPVEIMEAWEKLPGRVRTLFLDFERLQLDTFHP